MQIIIVIFTFSYNSERLGSWLYIFLHLVLIIDEKAIELSSTALISIVITKNNTYLNVNMNVKIVYILYCLHSVCVHVSHNYSVFPSLHIFINDFMFPYFA